MSARDRWLHRLHRLLLGLLWAATLAVVLAWIFNWPLPIAADPEPLSVLLGMISGSVTWLYGLAARRFTQARAELAEERYSLAHALEQAGPRAGSVVFYIYLPGELAELEDEAVKRTVIRMRGLGYETRTVQLDLRQPRPREVLSLLKSAADSLRYFDFPTTLLTLRQLVDFKLESRKDSSPEEARRELGRAYIEQFRAELQKQLTERDLARHVVLVDRRLTPLAPEATPAIEG
jgi:hypothetical protein